VLCLLRDKSASAGMVQDITRGNRDRSESGEIMLWCCWHFVRLSSLHLSLLTFCHSRPVIPIHESHLLFFLISQHSYHLFALHDSLGVVHCSSFGRFIVWLLWLCYCTVLYINPYYTLSHSAFFLCWSEYQVAPPFPSFSDLPFIPTQLYRASLCLSLHSPALSLSVLLSHYIAFLSLAETVTQKTFPMFDTFEINTL